MNDTQLLPNDLAACQRLVVEQARAITEQSYALVEQARAVLEQSTEITKLKQVVEEQQLTINKLLQQAYRNRSERYREDPQQMKIDFGNTLEAGDAADGLAQAVQEAEVVIAEHTRRRHKPRKAATSRCRRICPATRSRWKRPRKSNTAPSMARGS